MVQAWYMDDSNDDQRLEHHRNPPEYVSLQELFEKTGVEYFKINIDTYKTDGELEKLKVERGYTYEDEMMCSKECLQDYYNKIKMFYTEHLHTDEEIRLVVDGSGYFDVRDRNDEWIRVHVTAGDMLILPSGIYHRFTLDTKRVSPSRTLSYTPEEGYRLWLKLSRNQFIPYHDYIKAKRLFIGEPVWAAHNRPVDHMECRKQYINKLKQGFVKAA